MIRRRRHVPIRVKAMINAVFLMGWLTGKLAPVGAVTAPVGVAVWGSDEDPEAGSPTWDTLPVVEDPLSEADVCTLECPLFADGGSTELALGLGCFPIIGPGRVTVTRPVAPRLGMESAVAEADVVVDSLEEDVMDDTTTVGVGVIVSESGLGGVLVGGSVMKDWSLWRVHGDWNDYG
jgi:hypothetical protein